MLRAARKAGYPAWLALPSPTFQRELSIDGPTSRSGQAHWEAIGSRRTQGDPIRLAQIVAGDEESRHALAVRSVGDVAKGGRIMTQTETLVTPQLEAQKGVWTAEQVSDPISASDIRKWAIAVYWGETPPRIYWDEQYAKSTRWGGIVAPEDFNPFAWPIRTPPPPPFLGPLPSGRRGNALNGGVVDTLGVKMRPGDVITSRMRVTHWEERQGRNGLTLYMYVETQWTNQKDEIVKTRVVTIIRY
jgi:hypothetical protein